MMMMMMMMIIIIIIIIIIYYYYHYYYFISHVTWSRETMETPLLRDFLHVITHFQVVPTSVIDWPQSSN